MDEVQLDHRDMKPRPCSECELVIQETLQELDSDSGEYNYIESELIEYRDDCRYDEPDCEADLVDA